MQLPVHATPIFEKGFGTQLMLLGGSTRQQMLLYIEEKAKKILVVDEYNAVIRHIKQVRCNVLLLVTEMQCIFSGGSRTFFNPLSSNISVYILLTVVLIFLRVLGITRAM